jgi:K(+)-stimulated pyrophosphate-energized sodium pump
MNSLRHWLVPAVLLVLAGTLGMNTATAPAAAHAGWQPFAFWTDPAYKPLERMALLGVLGVAVVALLVAARLSRQIVQASTGTASMQAIAHAIRAGADAYLSRQFRVVAVLIVILAAVLVLTKWPWGLNDSNPHYHEHVQVALGRGIAFVLGAVFSATVGFCGMRLATLGNLRVAAAARESFATAFQLSFRTGTVVGLLTEGLGLLGAVSLFLYFGDKAFEALLGFGFGGTLLALFMRVGGGIYTKAADVGADLVGKIEKDIPEDDPRNAATIADNVGDNVGDCAGMAADVYESYIVTLVAAMILGLASFGHKGVIFPLLVQAVGVLVSLYSTLSVRTTASGGAAAAMQAINAGFRRGALILGLLTIGVGLAYLKFDEPYVVQQALERGLGADPVAGKVVAERLKDFGATPEMVTQLEQREALAAVWKRVPKTEQRSIASARVSPTETLHTRATQMVPIYLGYDLRPVGACLLGLGLVLAVMFCTEYWTSTEYPPVQDVAAASRTGHATNIIAGLAAGYESAVWAGLLIAAALMGAVLLFANTSPVFIAYGVALCGLGMLALTADTLSMDVFGPVADNANGIGEMGYNRDERNQPLSAAAADYIPPAEMTRARQALADLDATGNTTKAITKGVAIGSAVLAAASLFASFVAVLAKGRKDSIGQLSSSEFLERAGRLTVADPSVFIGMLLGGAVPFLFSAMTIRAVGRAAFLIVYECRQQFQDRDIWAGTKRPDYGRVVDICTATAQRELIGPGILALAAPVVVGFGLGPSALGGFLAGLIVTGMLLAVFMANAGGAWDNAKKLIEDQPRGPLTGKGSETHKASVTGDTVGDPLKDTAGPAINPLIKVMNMVSLLVLPAVVAYPGGQTITGTVVALLALFAVAGAWYAANLPPATPPPVEEPTEKRQPVAVE